ncbi:nucleotide-diphospho-sugar transferase [Boletus edulis]|uniref:UDP-N-acetylglucosamine diphosphorylase n=1 Tax=Boletus edulis BED1 TaxID=1328754 RepID=A0AAD4C192_BOLED|nr:nucleotide-diphospho-sugar transferase [Boletus edulis]KAF8445643.1 UDP-N-acetylglucosamine diphosphorylase [Boletus edulis BED1]
MAVEDIRTRYKAAGQDHLFTFWSKLTEEEHSALARQLEGIDVERVNRVYKKATSSESNAADPHRVADAIEPLPVEAYESVSANPTKASEWRQIGLQAVADGQVGVLLMAGGQGTRLGSSAPKGCYDIGLPSHKSLFQYQAERIAHLQTIAEGQFRKSKGSVVVPWYVMTSGPTRRETEAFFAKNNHFGLNAKNVIVFEQGTLPCLTMEGKIMLETTSRVAVAPDGNGGLYAATRAPLSPSDKSRTVLSDLVDRGIQYVHAYCVDNCLVKVADPVFLGYCIARQADCAAKVVPKTSPTESVGVVARRGDKFSVVEYSEITKEQAELRNEKTGELLFNAGNIANHFYTTAFLQSVESFEHELAHHIARKKIPTVDLETGQVIKPSKPNGMKLELFIFDVFPFTKNFAVLEVARREEFSPLKNAPGTGSDAPETSRRDLLDQHRRFLESAGACLKEGVEIELSPLVTYAGEGLESVKDKTFTKSGYVENLEELDALMY